MTNKEQFLRDLNKAFAENNNEYIVKFVTDDIQWVIIGEDTIVGKSNFTKALNEMMANEPFELNIDGITVHHQKGVVEGTITSPKGETYAFCDIYVFADTDIPLIKKMTSYVITLKKKAAKA